MSIRAAKRAASEVEAVLLWSSSRLPPKCTSPCMRLLTASRPFDSRRERRRDDCAPDTRVAKRAASEVEAVLRRTWWRLPPKCTSPCMRLLTASRPSDSRRERRRGHRAPDTRSCGRGKRQTAPGAQTGRRPRDTAARTAARIASVSATPETSASGKEDCGAWGAAGAAVRVPRAAETAGWGFGFVGKGARSRGLTGNSDHSLDGSARGAFRPLSVPASTGAATIACRPHAKTKASRRDTKPFFTGS